MNDMNDYGNHRQALDWAFQVDPFETDAERHDFLKTWKLHSLQYHEAPEFFDWVQALNTQTILIKDAIARHFK